MSRLQNGKVIVEGIVHLEDLPLEKFIDTVENLKGKIATEKLDGANLWFGVDEKGLFTSREGKSKRNGRFYSVDDYPVIAAYNGFRAAHLALEKVKNTILKVLTIGDIVEIEVLFGKQPNTVTYGMDGKNYIVILRGIGTDSKKVDLLGKKLNHTSVNVESTIVDSPDGDKLTYVKENLTWEFTEVSPVDSSKVNTADAIMKLNELKKFLSQKNATFSDKTNKEVAEIKLGSVDKANRDKMKEEREKLNDLIKQQYLLPIKEVLLDNYVRKIKPQLQADSLEPNEDIGVEGVVLRDKNSDDQVKLVDKDVFTALNSFNNSIRDVASGPVITDDKNAPLDKQGGAFGQAKIRIAHLLGIRELAVSSSARKTMARFQGTTPQETAENIAKVTHIESFPAMRQKVSAILQNAIEEVDKIVEKFKADSNTYKLKLKTGKEIGLSPAVIQRTLTAFAETKRDINLVDQAVDKAETPAELVMSLYGRTIQSLFKGSDNVKESFSLLKKLSEDDTGIPDGVPAAVTPPKDATTGADAIAPLQTSIGNGRNIVKRKRTFIMKRKFSKPAEGVSESLIRLVEFEVMNQHATDVDDKASAKNDIEFKQLRNNVSVGDNVTDMDVNRYLDKAHELNDEVDTVAFGLEMDDGSIAKVYVNSTQADAFEQALSQKLGETDDAEEAINDLAQTFDIVDVEWPNSSNATDTADQPADQPADALGSPEVTTTNSDTDNTPPVNPIIDLGNIEHNDGDEDEDAVDSNPDSGEGTTTDSGIDTTVFGDEDDGGDPGDDDVIEPPEADEPDEEDAANNSDADNIPPENKTDDEDDVVGGELAKHDDDDTPPEEGEGDDTETDDETEGDDNETEDDKQKTDDDDEDDVDDETVFDIDGKTNKKPKKTEESQMTFGQQFKSKLLTEKKAVKKDKPEDDLEQNVKTADLTALPANVTKLLQAFPNRGAKAMITLLYLLGAPVDAMSLKKADLRKSISDTADKFLKDSQFRNWVNYLTEELMKASSAPAESALDDQLGNVFQKMILEIMQKIGMPESVERLGRSALRASIRAKAKLATSNTKIRQYLKLVAEKLGIDPTAHDLKEDIPTAAAAPAAQAAGVDDTEETGNQWVDEIMKLASSLGIPDSILDYRRKQTELAVKQNRQNMSNYSLVLRNVMKLNAIIGNNQKN